MILNKHPDSKTKKFNHHSNGQPPLRWLIFFISSKLLGFNSRAAMAFYFCTLERKTSENGDIEVDFLKTKTIN